MDACILLLHVLAVVQSQDQPAPRVFELRYAIEFSGDGCLGVSLTRLAGFCYYNPEFGFQQGPNRNVSQCDVRLLSIIVKQILDPLP